MYGIANVIFFLVEMAEWVVMGFYSQKEGIANAQQVNDRSICLCYRACI